MKQKAFKMCMAFIYLFILYCAFSMNMWWIPSDLCRIGEAGPGLTI